jgi:tungstate transport system ATP-binding protein
MVFQRPVMLRRSVLANIRFALHARGVARALHAERVATALELTDLQALARTPARRLSGGEQQRLAIARAWVARPAVLFLDEPTASLDPRGVRAIEALIARVRAARTRVILTTHDLGQARRLADDVLFLAGGRLMEHSASASFFAAGGPATAQAAAFLRGDLID